MFFGAALGNVVRGVPLDASGYFFEPLWTNFAPGHETGILDWYTVLVGVCALAALAMHGALWVSLKTTGPVSNRSTRLAKYAWVAVILLTLVVSGLTFNVQPQVLQNFSRWPWGYIFPLLAITGAVGVIFFLMRRNTIKAFLSSCAYLTGMLTSVVFGVYPMVLPARDPRFSLTISNAKAGDYGLKVGLVWWIIGMILAFGYFRYLYRAFAGKVSVSPNSHSNSD